MKQKIPNRKCVTHHFKFHIFIPISIIGIIAVYHNEKTGSERKSNLPEWVQLGQQTNKSPKLHDVSIGEIRIK